MSNQASLENTAKLDERLRHIAFIMDGNGRWAKNRGMPRTAGHRAGAKTFQKIAKYCADRGLCAMTVYAFSTENWKRPKEEVDAIMDLLEQYLNESEKALKDYSISVRVIGDVIALRPSLQQKINALQKRTEGNDMILNIAINYGARMELCHAYEQLIARGVTKVTEDDISAALYTAGCPDPDMIVRTGGDYRISNFLLWQAAYAELYFTDVLWPDLTEQDVEKAIQAFYSRSRRYGGV